MDTTVNDIPMILDQLSAFCALRASGHLQMQQTKDEVETEIDWLYSRLLHHGWTPAQIAAAVPGVEVLA